MKEAFDCLSYSGPCGSACCCLSTYSYSNSGPS